VSDEETPSSVILPVAVSRALRQAGAHPSVTAVTVGKHQDDWTLAEVTIRTELPAAWRAAGQSPFGVRRLETVSFIFWDDFPLTSPWITLRSDFPRYHPHIQPDKAGKPVRPCLVLGSPREVIQARSFIGLIEQLVVWLERAAALELNDPAHGWEPVRRDSIDDILVLNAPRARALVTPDGGSAFVVTTYLHYPKSDFYKLFLGSEPVPIGPYLGKFLKRDEDEGTPSGSGLALIAWAGSTDGLPIGASLYLPETVENVGDLIDRAALYGCDAELSGALTSLRDALVADQPADKVPIAVVLLAKRPYNLVGADSPIEICPYLIEAAPGQDFTDAATKVRLAAHRETINPALLQRTSRDQSDLPTRPWTMIGCGSVGSKIVLHAARAGRAPSVLIDRGNLDAHNYARHAALPLGTADRMFVRAKADVSANQLAKLGQTATAVDADAITLLADEEGRNKLAPAGTAMIVDTTASIVTREALAHAHWADRPRAVEACLMGAGRLGYLALEGKSANPNLSDLAAEAYRRFAAIPDLASLAFGAEAEAIVIGQGCSAATFPMPDSELSILSAALSRPITDWARDDLPHAGQIRIGVTDDLGGLSWTMAEESPWTIVTPLDPQSPTVRIHPRVDAAIKQDVASWPDVETGGVLVGRFSQIGNCFQIVDLLPAPPDSTRSAEEFVLGRKGLRAAAHKIAKDTGGALQVVGTWHRHLAPSGPSPTDAIAGAILALRQFVPALLLIHTPAGYSTLVAEAVLKGTMGGDNKLLDA